MHGTNEPHVVFNESEWNSILRYHSLVGWELYRSEFLNVCMRFSKDRLRVIAGDGGYFEAEDFGIANEIERTVLIPGGALPAIEQLRKSSRENYLRLTFGEAEVIFSGHLRQDFRLIIPNSTTTYPDENKFLKREGDPTQVELHLRNEVRDALDELTAICLAREKANPHDEVIKVETEYDGQQLSLQMDNQKWRFTVDAASGPALKAYYRWYFLARLRDLPNWARIRWSWLAPDKVSIIRIGDRTVFFGPSLEKKKEASCASE